MTTLLELIEAGHHEQIKDDVTDIADDYMRYLPPCQPIRAIIRADALTDEFVAQWLPIHPNLICHLHRVHPIMLDQRMLDRFEEYLNEWRIPDGVKTQEIADYAWRNGIMYIVPDEFIREEWIDEITAELIPQRFWTPELLRRFTYLPHRTWYGGPISPGSALELARLHLPLRFFPVVTAEILANYMFGHLVESDLSNIPLDVLENYLASQPPDQLTSEYYFPPDISAEAAELILRYCPEPKISWTRRLVKHISATPMHGLIPEYLRAKHPKRADPKSH